MNLFNGEKSIHQDAYSHIDENRMELRDFLAIDRTTLSNQNTFLAYVRTALTLFVAGLSFIRFFDLFVIEAIGWVFIPLGVATFLVGAIRYNRIRIVLERMGHTRSE